MRAFIKNMFFFLPLPFRRACVRCREWWWRKVMGRWERRTYGDMPDLAPRDGRIKNVLVYHINGLTHGGTEKTLQIIANSLVENYNVFYMYGDKTAEEGRKTVLDERIKLIPFSYETDQVSVPHRLTKMEPHLKEVLASNDIDLLIVASPGYSHYPWNLITHIPIVLLNIFGSPTLQENIRQIIYISNETRRHAESWIGHQDIATVAYCPINDPPRYINDNLRDQLGIPPKAFVIGRIGRADDAIFDPIGIRAFSKVVKIDRHVHYVIMSPPPILQKIVQDECIPNVHFIPPSGDENIVWSFHKALDAFAHFRLDGETSGVAIAESLTVGNPIITHRSHKWNAHLEYLETAFSRIAETDDISSYAEFIVEFAQLKALDPEKWARMRKLAQDCGERNFSPASYTKRIIDIITKIQ